MSFEVARQANVHDLGHGHLAPVLVKSASRDLAVVEFQEPAEDSFQGSVEAGVKLGDGQRPIPVHTEYANQILVVAAEGCWFDGTRQNSFYLAEPVVKELVDVGDHLPGHPFAVAGQGVRGGRAHFDPAAQPYESVSGGTQALDLGVQRWHVGHFSVPGRHWLPVNLESE